MSFIWYIGGRPESYSGSSIAPRGVERITAAHPTARVVQGSTVQSHAEQEHAHSAAETYRDAAREQMVRKPAILVSQIMSSPVITLLLTQTALDAASLFNEKRFRHIPVVSPAGVLCGILSDRDLLHHASHPQVEANTDKRVSDIMTTRVLTATPETEIRSVARTMFQERIGCMPVLDSGKVVGIVTRSDILRTVMNVVPLELWV